VIRLLDPSVARATWTVLLMLGTLALVYALGHVLLLLVFSLVFTYLVFPVVRLLERMFRGAHRRTLAIAVVYLVLASALSAVVALAGPRLTRELAALGQRIPELSTQIQGGQILGNLFPTWRGAAVVDDLVRANLPQALAAAQGLLTGLIGWISGAWVVVLIPVFAFFFMREAERATGALTALIDDDAQRQLWSAIGHDLHLVLRDYLGALIVLSLLTFGVWSVLFLAVGVPYALVLAAIGAVLELLPLVGPAIAGVIVVVVALFSGFTHPWLLALFVLLWRLIQDYVTSPLVMGRGVELHPALVIFGVLAGGELAGVAGMFLSIPALAGLRVVWRRLYGARTGPR
jgi:predicted PurR-regulated permease PerM